MMAQIMEFQKSMYTMDSWVSFTYLEQPSFFAFSCGIYKCSEITHFLASFSKEIKWLLPYIF